MRATLALQVGKFRHNAITTKDVGRGFYKGNRTGAMGRHTKYGGYVIEWNRVRTYVVPQGMNELELTPFVTEKVESTPGRYAGTTSGPRDAAAYLQRWKDENGVD